MKHAIAALGSVLVLVLSLPSYSQNQQQPATLRSLLLHELHTTHNKADWFVPISVAVDGLTAEQASWQPPAGGHSAGQLTYHLLFWDRRNLVKFKGETQEKFGGDNEETFVKFDSKQWSDTVKQLDQVMTELEKLVETADEKSWPCGRQRLRISVRTMLTTSGRSSMCASCKGRGTPRKV